MNIKELRNKAGLTQQELADKTGIPRTRIAKWEEGKGRPKSADTITLVNLFSELISNFQELADKGEQYSTPKNVTLLETQQEVKDFISRRRDKKNHDQGPIMVPLVAVAAQAGYSKGYSNTDYINKLEMFPILPGINPRGAIWRYWEVEGDSMEKTFKNGQYLLTSQVPYEDWEDLKDYLVYVIVTDDLVTIKRLAKKKGKDYWVAISDNEAKYDQFPIKITDVKELWKYRRHTDWDASPPKKFEIKI